MMMLEDRFFDQEWVQELSNEDFRMLLYLLHFASNKTGIVELNMRQINFSANTGRTYTKEDVLSRFGNMIKVIPGHDNTAIFSDYIATNWAKNGKPIDAVRNPLFKSVVAELARFGMTLDDVNAMAKKQVVVAQAEAEREDASTVRRDGGEERIRKAEAEEMFSKFWTAYPKECPRKTDKRKCLAKFIIIMNHAKDKAKTFESIMSGLERWKKCSTWNKDNGQFIRAPLVWLNNSNWEDEPTIGGPNNGNGNRHPSANANYTSSRAAGLF